VALCRVRVADHQSDGVRETFPAFELARELPSARGRERIELRLAARVGDSLLRPDPSLLLEAMQSRIERALRDLQGVPAHLLDALPDRPAVLRFERQRLEDQQIERALNQV